MLDNLELLQASSKGLQLQGKGLGIFNLLLLL
jgi:hypothetical protein